MFHRGELVKCIVVDDEMADGRHVVSFALLNRDSVYRVVRFFTPEESKRCFPDSPWFHEPENGGRIELKEFPGCSFFGKRFESTVGNRMIPY